MAKKAKTAKTPKTYVNPITEIINTQWPKVYGYGRSHQYGPLTKLAMYAEVEGFTVCPQGSKANVFGVNDATTNKRILTPYMNKSGNALYLCLNGIGTRKKLNDKLPENILQYVNKNEMSYKFDGNYISIIANIETFTIEHFRQLVELIPCTNRQPSTQNTRPTK